MSVVYSPDMAQATYWRPVFPRGIRHQANLAGAENDLGAGKFAILCTRYVLDRLGKLPPALALDEIEQFVTAGWDLAHSSLEREACATQPLRIPRPRP